MNHFPQFAGTSLIASEHRKNKERYGLTLKARWAEVEQKKFNRGGE